MRRSVLIILATVVLGLAAGPALAGNLKQVRYIGIHPLPKAEGGGICYIEGPHVHIYGPAGEDKVQYRDHHGSSYFVGDPVAYGYDGKRYAYKGHHPIHVAAVVGDDDPADVYCYINGPHFHYFAPPDGPDFKIAGDAYFYVGEPPRAYVDARPAMMKINAVYQPLVYERPVVEVDAPVGWIGARAELIAPAVVVAPAAAVVVPRAGVSVEAHIPTPSLHVDVGIGLPGVVVRERPAVIVRERPVIIEERVRIKHDHGRHRGHWK
ncbi:MAG TPA: hypothetical protein VLM79_04340 [Kofleriaceae bacterium]|nr:hypothetical protein [Kofleriaceae bacterium]